VGTFLAILKAIPETIKMIREIHSVIMKLRVAQIENKTAIRNEDMNVLLTKIKKARSDEERLRLAKALGNLSSR